MLGSVKKFFQEFRDFAFKGNMIDLAVAVVIGKAVGDLIASIVGNIVMPLVGWVVQHGEAAANKGGVKLDYTQLMLGPVKVGAFLGDLLNFVLITLAVFISIVKLLQIISKLTVNKKPEAPAAPTMKECPMCCSSIPIKAIKCPQCTADLPKPA